MTASSAAQCGSVRNLSTQKLDAYNLRTELELWSECVVSCKEVYDMRESTNAWAAVTWKSLSRHLSPAVVDAQRKCQNVMYGHDMKAEQVNVPAKNDVPRMRSRLERIEPRSYGDSVIPRHDVTWDKAWTNRCLHNAVFALNEGRNPHNDFDSISKGREEQA